VCRRSGGGEPDLSISISYIMKCIITLQSIVKIGSAILWSLAGRKPEVFYQPRLSWLSQQPVPQHMHLCFSTYAPCGVPEPKAEQFLLSSPGAERDCPAFPKERFMRCLTAGDTDTDHLCLGRKGMKRVHFQKRRNSSCHSGTWLYPSLG